MANTEHEHAGNADQLRELQNKPVARCNICHFALGQEVSDENVVLALVYLPGMPILACQFCIQLTDRVGLTWAQVSAGARPLTASDEAENQKLLTALQGEKNG